MQGKTTLTINNKPPHAWHQTGIINHHIASKHFLCEIISIQTPYQNLSNFTPPYAETYWPLSGSLTHLLLNMVTILQTTFSKAFSLEWKFMHFDSNFTAVCSLGFNWQWVCVGSGNGLAPDGWQAITWINADPVHRRIYAVLGGAMSLLIEAEWCMYASVK